MKASVYCATSLDGFIARPDGDVDWLGDTPAENEEDYGYGEFFESVDVLVMGRKTFEKVLSFGAWPYGDKPTVVLSSRSLGIPEGISSTVESMSCSPDELVKRLSKRGVKHLYVDGGKTVQGFLAAGLIQRLILTTVPVLIGNGIPLFGTLEHDIKLRHIKTRAFPSGLVQSQFEVASCI